MIDDGWTLTLLGAFLLLGVLADAVGRRAHVPRVTLLLLLGFALGPSATRLVPEAVAAWFPFAARIALSLVGFMLGERLFLGNHHRPGGARTVLEVSLAESLTTALVVTGALWGLGVPLALALLLGGIAPATAPAATLDVVRESGARGPLTDLVTAVVAIDDAYGVILFGVFLVVSMGVTGGAATGDAILEGLFEIAGGIGLGAGLGLPMAWVTGRVRPGELTLLETLGFVLLCGGLASTLEVSYLLACVALGGVVARRARHHARPLVAIERVSGPFLVVFFLLAGFEFEPQVLGAGGALAALYVLARAAGKVGGGYLGARAAGLPPPARRAIGFCLLPQAGVALGMGLIAAERVPGVGRTLLSLLVGTTFAFEVVGPLATRAALAAAGETRAARAKAEKTACPTSGP